MVHYFFRVGGAAARLLALAAAICVWTCGRAAADGYINEIYFDPPSGGDSTQEYIELRGTPGMSLDNHYLIFLENENNSMNDPFFSGPPGTIDFVLDLNGRSFSPSGFLSFRQKGTTFTNVPASAFNLVNTGSGVGWGISSADNNIGVSSNTGEIENSGFTAMLIRNDGNPTLGKPVLSAGGDPMTDPNNLDHDNNGLDFLETGGPHWVINNHNPDPGANRNWTILDSIGVFSSVHKVDYGRTYSPITFGPEYDGQQVSYEESGTLEQISHAVHPNLDPSLQTYKAVGAELEYIGRYGNSTGSTEHDWHASNLTNNGLAGFTGVADGFRQSGSDNHGFPRDPNPALPYASTCEFASSCYPLGYLTSESSQYVPYGTNLNDTIGSANYPLNQSSLPWDFNHDSVVDAADYTVWRNSLGQADPDPRNNPLAANATRSSSVDFRDYLAWKYHYGESLPMGGAAGLASNSGGQVPEPTALVLAVLALAGLVMTRKPR